VGEGSMNKAASYIIFRDSSTYYALNGETGDTDYYSTNYTAVFEYSLDNLGVGGIIHHKKGYYVGKIVIDRSNVIVQGEGSYGNVPLGADPGKAPDWLNGTVIRPSGSGDHGIYISGENRTGIQIRNLGIWFSTAST